jgi:hypothetical protein
MAEPMCETGQVGRDSIADSHRRRAVVEHLHRH